MALNEYSICTNKNTHRAGKSFIFATSCHGQKGNRSTMAKTRKGSAKRSAPSYIMAIVGVSLVLFLLGILGWIIINANKLGEYFKENIAMNVYIRENVSPRDSAALVSYILAQPYVKDYEYVTKDLAKKKYLQDGNKDWGALLDRNPLPASIDFRITKEYASIDSLSKIKNELVQNIAVSDVQYPQSLVTNLNNIINKISIILLSVIVIISILVIFLIDNTIRLAMFSNRFLIKTMQMVGATRGFISRPLELRAFINGLVSGLLAVGGLIAIIIFAENQLPYLKALRDYPLLLMLFIVIILLGICISFFSTHRSVLKYLKMKLDELY
jgi:cell division transport system permease protein